MPNEEERKRADEKKGGREKRRPSTRIATLRVELQAEKQRGCLLIGKKTNCWGITRRVSSSCSVRGASSTTTSQRNTNVARVNRPNALGILSRSQACEGAQEKGIVTCTWEAEAEAAAGGSSSGTVGEVEITL